MAVTQSELRLRCVIMFTIILLIFLLSVFIIASGIKIRNDAAKCKVPGLKPLPIIGNGHKFLGDSAYVFNRMGEIIKKYGDISQFYLGSDRMILIADPKYVEAITSNNEYNTKSDMYKYLHPWLGRGLLNAEGNQWRNQRKFLTPAFHFNILKTFLPIFLKNDEIFVEKLKVLATGKPIDVFPVLALLALDNVSESAMGASVNAQVDTESEYVKAVHEISEIIFSRMLNIFMGIDFIFNLTPYKKIQDRAISVLHKQTLTVIKNRKKYLEESNTTMTNYEEDIGLKKKSAFLDLLLLATVDGEKLSEEDIRQEVDTFMFAGHDTTTSAMSFALYCISQHGAVQDKLLEEQQTIFGDDLLRHPTYTELGDMKYLEAVIKESLRVYPAVPLIGRKLTQDTTIQDYFIPRDTSILINIAHMHQNPNIFDDPTTFRPERFGLTTSDQKAAYNFIPFSAGARNCIGQKFAMLEMKTVLSSVIRRFQLLPSGSIPILCNDLILRSKNGVYVSFLPRKY